jgi:predicted TIM-barrel fold metal-dependent hydrolase
MFTVPGSRSNWQATFSKLVKDAGSADMEHPASFLFGDVPDVESADFFSVLTGEMDRFGIDQGYLPVAENDEWGSQCVQRSEGRLRGVGAYDPHDPVGSVRALRRLHADGLIRAVSIFPAGTMPPIAIDDREMYPAYVLCCELGLPVFINIGVPGPRFPMLSQHPAGLDQVCYDFPDLVVITRHGGEPWVDLTVKLLLKWPNLYYSTSAFAPKYYPPAIIDYANTRGADKVIYGGYFPSGLSLDRIFRELPNVGLRSEVWPKFLSDNARRVLGD